jgi:hypothetical protein
MALKGEHEGGWWDLCRRAWVEEDPVKFLELSMQITRFLARKQERLDADYAQAEQANQAQSEKPLN